MVELPGSFYFWVRRSHQHEFMLLVALPERIHTHYEYIQKYGRIREVNKNTPVLKLGVTVLTVGV